MANLKPKKSAEKNTVKKSGKVSATNKKKVVKKPEKTTKNPAKKKNVATEERSYTLDAVLVINNAHMIYGQLNTLIDAKKDILIDASSVEMVDTSILQLLLSFVLKQQQQSLKVSWLNPSSELLTRAKMLDVANQLGLQKG
jgi:anti-anti-sigma regulatory factor